MTLTALKGLILYHGNFIAIEKNDSELSKLYKRSKGESDRVRSPSSPHQGSSDPPEFGSVGGGDPSCL